MSFGRGLVATLLLTALAYGAVVAAGFVWDDQPLVVDNLLTGDLGNLPQFFVVDLWQTAGGVQSDSGYYRPLMLLSLAVDRALWGLSPAGHHLHSLGWHLVATGLLALVLRQVVQPVPALIGAALFAVHPVQSEAVVWIAARNDLMVAAFSFGAVLALLRQHLVLGGVLALMALLSKESGLFTVGLLLAVTGGRVTWRQLAPLGVAAAVWLVLRNGVAQVGSASVPGAVELGFLARRLPQVVAHYSDLLLTGGPLSVGATLEYLEVPWPAVVLHLVALAGLTALAVRRGGRPALGGVLFAGLALGPAVLAIAVRGQLGERYLYLPMAGLALALATAVPASRRSAGAAVVLALLAAWGINQRLPDWVHNQALFAAAVQTHPHGASYAAVGHELNLQGDIQACDWFRAALEDQPAYVDVCPQAVRCALKRGDLAQAALGAEVTARRCPRTAQMAGLEGLVWIQRCDYDRARAAVQDIQPVADARLPLVLGVLARDLDDPVAYAQVQSLVPDVPSFDQQVQQLRGMCP